MPDTERRALETDTVLRVLLAQPTTRSRSSSPKRRSTVKLLDHHSSELRQCWRTCESPLIDDHQRGSDQTQCVCRIDIGRNPERDLGFAGALHKGTGVSNAYSQSKLRHRHLGQRILQLKRGVMECLKVASARGAHCAECQFEGPGVQLGDGVVAQHHPDLPRELLTECRDRPGETSAERTLEIREDQRLDRRVRRSEPETGSP
jgi:hypothetical protein